MGLARACTLARWLALRVLPTVAGIVLACFALLQLAPGDAADVAAAEAGDATAETMAQLRAHHGLDRGTAERLLAYAGGLARLSLGTSTRYNLPVLDVVLQRLPDTLLLMGLSALLALVLGVALGVLMAHSPRRWLRTAGAVLTTLLYSTPGFVVGLLLILAFSVGLGWLPSEGAASAASGYRGNDWLLDRARHLVLPALTLAAFSLAAYARLTQALMRDIHAQDFVRTAVAKGLEPARIATRHVLRAALVPILSVAGTHFATLLGGAAVVESVFNWPGLGRLTLEAVQSRDLQLLLGIVLLSALCVIAVNVLVDLLQAWLDPRIRLG